MVTWTLGNEKQHDAPDKRHTDAGDWNPPPADESADNVDVQNSNGHHDLKKGSEHSPNVRRGDFRDVNRNGDGGDSGPESDHDSAEEQHPLVHGGRQHQVADGQENGDDVHGKFSAEFTDQSSATESYKQTKTLF